MVTELFCDPVEGHLDTVFRPFQRLDEIIFQEKQGPVRRWAWLFLRAMREKAAN